MTTLTAACPGPPPDSPQASVPLQRALCVDNTYPVRGTYGLRAFMRLHAGPRELWLASEPVVITVR
jgi:hypothetical protein